MAALLKLPLSLGDPSALGFPLSARAIVFDPHCLGLSRLTTTSRSSHRIRLRLRLVVPFLACDIGRARDKPTTVDSRHQHVTTAPMAADFIMPRMADPQQQLQQQQQQKQSLFYPPAQQYAQQLQHPPKYAQAPAATPFQTAPRRAAATITPQISPLSTSGSTSPTSPKNRPPRPIYMPAVLRPTEFPSKAVPVSPKPEDGVDADERTIRSNASFMSMGALGRLSRRSTDDSGKCVDESWNLDMFPKPSAAPTRAHWKVCFRYHHPLPFHDPRTAPPTPRE